MPDSAHGVPTAGRILTGGGIIFPPGIELTNDDLVRADPVRSKSPFLNTRQAAHYVGLSMRHLERLRRRGGGPPFRKHCRLVYYHVDELIAWSRTSRAERIDG